MPKCLVDQLVLYKKHNQRRSANSTEWRCAGFSNPLFLNAFRLMHVSSLQCTSLFPLVTFALSSNTKHILVVGGFRDTVLQEEGLRMDHNTGHRNVRAA